MSNSNRQDDSAEGHENTFTSTHWSVVLAAANSDSPQAQAARQKLCTTYWYPLYGFLRRTGYSHHDAEDLTQGCLTHLINNKAFGDVAPEKGKFRSYLLKAIQYYAGGVRDRAAAEEGRRLRDCVAGPSVGGGTLQPGARG